MERKKLDVLIVNDDDMDCTKNKSEVTLDDIKITKLGFKVEDLEKYDVIIYKGRLGKKAIRLRV